MITANLAGTHGSHLRSERRDSPAITHSRLNLSDGLDGDGNGDINNGEQALDPEAAKKLQAMVREYRIKRCLRDYQTWGYLTCVALVVISAIVLIILAASGVLSADTDR